MVNLRHPYLAAAHIRHLLWHRYLDTDFDQAITEATVLRTTRKAQSHKATSAWYPTYRLPARVPKWRSACISKNAL